MILGSQVFVLGSSAHWACIFEFTGILLFQAPSVGLHPTGMRSLQEMVRTAWAPSSRWVAWARGPGFASEVRESRLSGPLTYRGRESLKPGLGAG